MEIGDKRSQNGSILRWEIEEVSSKTAFKMAQYLSDYSTYQRLLKCFSEKRLKLLFASYFKQKIYTVITELMIINWEKKNGINTSRRFVVCSRFPWFELLQLAWPDPVIRVEYQRERGGFKNDIKNWLKETLLEHHILPKNAWCNPCETVKHLLWKGNNGLHDNKKCVHKNNACIAVCFREGIDIEKRSDLFWLPNSCIDPGKILVYFDGIVQSPLRKKTLLKLDEMGVAWISLFKGCVPTRDDHFWAPKRKEDLTVLIRDDAILTKTSLTEKWLYKFSIGLLNKVCYWKELFESFSVKIHLDIKEYGMDILIKNLAMDLVGGLCIGKERSSLRNMPSGSLLGCYPSHVFFSWNKDSLLALSKRNNTGAQDYIIISGNINDYSFSLKKSQNMNKSFLKNKPKLTIGLFDNLASKNTGTSIQRIFFSHMEKFYKSFLNWVLEDEQIGLIIKSKKPMVLENFREINELIKVAQATGRCLFYTSEPGIFQSDIASIIDIAVTIGLVLPGTFVDLALCGCKVVHYDATNIRPFEKELYKWGYGKIIFDDIDEMVAASRRYKKDPDSYKDFGDFSQHLDELDPFRDGKAFRRVGGYLYNLLEILDNGEGRDKAIQYANKIYADTWGKDKVVKVL